MPMPLFVRQARYSQTGSTASSGLGTVFFTRIATRATMRVIERGSLWRVTR